MNANSPCTSKFYIATLIGALFLSASTHGRNRTIEIETDRAVTGLPDAVALIQGISINPNDPIDDPVPLRIYIAGVVQGELAGLNRVTLEDGTEDGTVITLSRAQRLEALEAQAIAAQTFLAHTLSVGDNREIGVRYLHLTFLK